MSIALDDKPRTWQVQPGWGISVDITPGQVVQARQVKTNQRLIGLALGLVLVACVGVSLLVLSARAGAQRDYDAEQARTATLAQQSQQYADVTAMQSATTRIKGELSTLLTDDVDVVNLMARVNKAVPAGVEISSQSVVMTPVEPAAPATDTTATGSTTTDTTGAPAPAPSTAPQVIGTLTIGGTANRIDDVTPFIDALTQLRGVVDVVPASVARNDTGTTYSISMNLTDVLYTGRYTAGPAQTEEGQP